MANKPSSKLKPNANKPEPKNVKNSDPKINGSWLVVISAQRLTNNQNKYILLVIAV